MKPLHPGNFECFMEVYQKHLKACLEKYPDQYAWNIDELDTVLNRMRTAIERGSFNKESKAFKDTCKELGINHTYKAIQEFITL